MIKRVTKLLVLAICVMSAVFFASCSFSFYEYDEIDAPAVTVISQDDRIKVLISEVSHASSYTVRIDGADTDTYNTYLDATNIMTDAKVYTISARANAKTGYKSSGFGEEVLYSAGSKMGTPEIVLYDKVLGWEQDVSASNYTVTIDLPTGGQKVVSTYYNRYNFTNDLTSAGVYAFKVVAHSAKVGVEDSEESNVVCYTYYKTHTTPTNLEVQERDGEVILSFADPDNANSYMVKIDNTTYGIAEKSVSLTALGHDFSAAKRYYISVKSSEDLEHHYNASEYSQEVYYDKYEQLNIPNNLAIVDNNNQLLVRWDAVTNARLYSLFINDEVTEPYAKNISATQIILSRDLLNDDGQLSVRVLAEGYGHYLASLASNKVYYQYVEKLGTPKDLSIQTIGDFVHLGWTAVENTYRYEVEINSVRLEYTTTNSIELSNFFNTAGSYTMRVAALPSVDNQAMYVRSDYSDTIVYTYVLTLARPTIISVDRLLTGEYFLRFQGNNDAAQSYRVYLDDVLVMTDVVSTSVNITGLLTTIGSKNVAVQAVAATSSYYRDSVLSEAYSFAYKTELAMPTNVKVDEINNKLTWDVVPNAVDYSIYINDAHYTSLTNEFDISDYYTSAGVYIFKVAAQPDANSYYLGSQYYEVVKQHTVTLKAPTNVEAYWDTDGKAYVRFDLVEHADYYEINITMNLVDYITPKPTTTSSPYEITSYMSSAGLYIISVRAIGTGFYYTSVWSNNYQLQKDVTLSTPSNISVEKSNVNESLYVHFNGDSNATSYNAIINDNAITGITTTSFDIKNYVTFEGVYRISIQAVGAGAYSNSEYSTTYNYNHAFTNRYDYSRCKVFMYGEEVDFYIDSFDELLKAMWYNYLYNARFPDSNDSTKTVLKLYLPSGTNVFRTPLQDYFSSNYDLHLSNTQLSGAGNILSYALYAYPEYVAYSNFTVNYTSNEYMCKYKNEMNFNHTSKFDYTSLSGTYNQNQINAYLNATFVARNNVLQPANYLANADRDRADNFDDFAINSKAKAPVYNSEQLFMVAQHGRQPEFMTENSVAETIYNNAKSVLRRIIKSTYTEYEKAKAIYDWLTIHCVYNYDVIMFSSYVSGGSNVNTVGQYKEFYLEGVLYDLDDSVAVCDGISKAFVLLCQIEGIETYKCNGNAGSEGNESSWGGHAWNKINIGGSWYVVDSTWDDQLLTFNNGNDHVLSATHQYFLVKESYITPTHTEQYPKRSDVTCSYNYNHPIGSSHDYGYFGATQYTGLVTVDLVIGNGLSLMGDETYNEAAAELELANLIRYCYDHEIYIVEFWLSDCYLAAQEAYNTLGANNNYNTLVDNAYTLSGVNSGLIKTEPTSFDKTEPFHYIILAELANI